MDLTLDVPSITWRCVEKRPPASAKCERHVKSSTEGQSRGALMMLSCGMLVTSRSRRNFSQLGRHAIRKSFECFPGGEMEHGDAECSADRVADLFLQLPLRNGVLLSGVLTRDPPKVHLLPPPAMPPLAIVPRDGAACVPFTEVENPKNSEVLRRFHPGPLQPDSASGKALGKSLQRAPEEFEILSRYEHLRAATSRSSPSEEQAEVLLLDVYMRFQSETGAPPRPSAESEEAYDLYIHTCRDVSMKALHRTCSPDFCMIAEAHVLGLAKNSGFPRLRQNDARAMYASAMRFGYAVRQAEIRHQADGAVGTFVPLPVESEMCRKELESLWMRPAVSGSTQDLDAGQDAHQATLHSVGYLLHEDKDEEPSLESDSAAAHRSLKEVFSRLKRMGEAKPGLATYLGWLGKFDPDALTILSTPSHIAAWAMKLQADAIWGKADQALADEIVASTPADMLEAILFGAWLHDAEVSAEEYLNQHGQMDEGEGCADQSG